MSNLNNFDKSSTGTDIEFTGFRDTDEARRDFEENIKIIQHDGYRTTSIGYYIGGGAPGPDTVKFTVKGKKKDKQEYLIKEGRFEASDIRKWSVETLNEEILSSNEDATLINYAMSCVSSRHGYFPVLPVGLEIAPVKNLIAIETRGYSQGDYAVVLYCPHDLKREWGNFPKQANIQKSVDHLYWDAPVYAQFTINGEEYSFYDSPHDDSYEWDKDKFVSWVSEQSKIPVAALAPFVPETLDYQY